MILLILIPWILIVSTFFLLILCLAILFRDSKRKYIHREILRSFIILALIQISAMFFLNYFGRSLYTDYHYIYLFSVGLAVFLLCCFPIPKIPMMFNNADRLLLAFLASLLSVNISEFSFFSVYSTDFSLWTVYILWWIIIIAVILIINTYNFLSPRKKIQFLFPWVS